MHSASSFSNGNNVQNKDPRVPRTRPNSSLLPILSSCKASRRMSHVRTVARICWTAIFIGSTCHFFTKAYLKHHPPPYPSRHILGPLVLCWQRSIHWWKLLVRFLLAAPILYIFVVVLAALERTPVTGRLRFISLSPDEEVSLIANHTLPEVLRHECEQASRVQDSSEVRDTVQEIFNNLIAVTRFLAFPPLSPEESGSGHNQCSNAVAPGVALTNNGGPLLPCPRIYLVDDAHATAYSYGPSISTGFIVLHSSLLRRLDLDKTTSTPTGNRHLVAFIIAHELGHLLLCHHLESISQMLFYPSLGAVMVDFFRCIFYPFFVMFGPFVEEGMHAMGRVTITEGGGLARLCFSRTVEIEADSLALRLLVLAGFDPIVALETWENRAELATPEAIHSSYLDSHPRSEGRIHHLRQEAARIIAEYGSAKS